ncbi:MAG: hypothetical protein LBC64_11025 [Fibromonadaceae bacterium]|jgi:DNA gyrase/topoisomerase IV subunit B|nr:hypothetical protein [Fibromonadaceae bacterium]
MIYNINKGHNVDMAGKSLVLSGYEEFIAQIKENLKSMELREAIRLAIKSCISKNILVSFLEKNGSEVENMLLSEWDQDEALAVRYEEGREEGRNEAREELFALWEKGISLAEAKKRLNL